MLNQLCVLLCVISVGGWGRGGQMTACPIDTFRYRGDI